jgi:hypothetical protein
MVLPGKCVIHLKGEEDQSEHSGKLDSVLMGMDGCGHDLEQCIYERNAGQYNIRVMERVLTEFKGRDCVVCLHASSDFCEHYVSVNS